ncbi:MAG: DUF2474 family protein [Rhodoblastus sp.]|nr:MAG: DUF2474 family protein [Rhodoblastus sp.]
MSPRARDGLGRRLAWFVALWVAGVVALGVAAAALRAVLAL